MAYCRGCDRDMWEYSDEAQADGWCLSCAPECYVGGVHEDAVDRGEGVATDGGEPVEAERVERTDVGVSVTVEMKRGTGTRDQDKIVAKAKAETREEAQHDVDQMRSWLRELAEDVRTWQPEADGE